MDSEEINNILNWWETKRLLFNSVVGFSGIIGIVITGEFEFILFDIIGILLWGILANVLYSTGIIVELLDIYYMKKKLRLYNYRWLFYILGTITYCILTFSYAVFYYTNL